MDITKEIRKICQKGYDENNDFYQLYCVETGEDMSELLGEFLSSVKDAGEIKDYKMSYFDFDGGPGYSSGVIFMAWTSKDDELVMTSYTWEAM